MNKEDKSINPIEDVLYELLEAHIGKDNAIRSYEIEKTLNISGSVVRHLVNNLRTAGKPICSGGTGYFLAANQEELTETIAQLNSRKNSIEKAVKGMLEAS